METSSHKENFIMRVKLEAFALKSALTIFNQMPVEIFPSKFKTKNVGLAFLSIQLPSVFWLEYLSHLHLKWLLIGTYLLPSYSFNSFPFFFLFFFFFYFLKQVF